MMMKPIYGVFIFLCLFFTSYAENNGKEGCYCPCPCSSVPPSSQPSSPPIKSSPPPPVPSPPPPVPASPPIKNSPPPPVPSPPPLVPTSPPIKNYPPPPVPSTPVTSPPSSGSANSKYGDSGSGIFHYGGWGSGSFKSGGSGFGSGSGSFSLQGSFNGSFSKVFAFGDSYTDTGNAFISGAIANFISAFTSPYGISFGKTSNRLCDGRLVIDFLTEALALPTLPCFKNASANFACGANFAIAGATALSNAFFGKDNPLHNLITQGIPIGLQIQADWFKNFMVQHSAHVMADIDNALFWIGEMGINDYSRIVGSSISGMWLAENSVNHVCSILETILNHGAKYVVIQGMPPVGCLPLDISICAAHDRDEMGCSSTINAAAMNYNKLLQAKLDMYRKLHPGCILSYADHYNAFHEILKNPAKYEFQETFKTCCGSGSGGLNFNLNSLCGASGTSACSEPSKYMMWDGIHLTEAMNKHLTELFLTKGFCQPSFEEIVNKKKGM